MARLLKSMMKPKNASCAWNTDRRFWNHGYITCKEDMRIAAVSGTLLIDIFANTYGYYDNGGGALLCAGASGYVTVVYRDYVKIDIWKALADGVWTSSCVIGVAITGNPASTALARVIPGAALLPAVADSALKNMGYPASCAAAFRGYVVTVYDDGTYTST